MHGTGCHQSNKHTHYHNQCDDDPQQYLLSGRPTGTRLQALLARRIMTLDHDGDATRSEQRRQNHNQRNRGTGIGRMFGLL